MERDGIRITYILYALGVSRAPNLLPVPFIIRMSHYTLVATEQVPRQIQYSAFESILVWKEELPTSLSFKLFPRCFPLNSSIDQIIPASSPITLKRRPIVRKWKVMEARPAVEVQLPTVCTLI